MQTPGYSSLGNINNITSLERFVASRGQLQRDHASPYYLDLNQAVWYGLVAWLSLSSASACKLATNSVPRTTGSASQAGHRHEGHRSHRVSWPGNLLQMHPEEEAAEQHYQISQLFCARGRTHQDYNTS